MIFLFRNPEFQLDLFVLFFYLRFGAAAEVSLPFPSAPPLAPDGHDGVLPVPVLAVLVHVTALPALVAVLYAQRSVIPAIVLIFQPNVPGLVPR